MKLNLTAILTTAIVLTGTLHVNALDNAVRNWNRLIDSNGIIDCAPEVKQGNLAAADKALKQLAENELKESSKFKQIILDAVNLPTEMRMSAYLQLVGVTDDKEIAEFVGARDVDQKYIKTLSSNTDLNDAQSRLVIDRLTSSLLGKIK